MQTDISGLGVQTRYGQITAIVIMVMIASILAVGLAIWRIRDDTISAATKGAKDVADMLSLQAGHSIQSIELVLDEIREEIRRQNVLTEEDFKELVSTQTTFRYLGDRRSRVPQADVVTLTDSGGQVLAITRSWPTPPVNLADRDYFQHFATSDDDGLFISVPVENKLTGARIIYFAKAVRGPDGRLLGVALIGIRPEYFLETFGVISGWAERSLNVLRRDGTLLLRFPDVEAVHKPTRIPTNSPGLKPSREAEVFTGRPAVSPVFPAGQPLRYSRNIPSSSTYRSPKTPS